MLLLERLWRPRPAVVAGKALYASAVDQARLPAFYTDLGASDTPEGRFEVYTLHVLFLIERLKGQGEQAAETSQALFDAYVRGLDDAFREWGIGDSSLARKVKKLGKAFFGRAKNYDEAVAALPARAALEGLVTRTVHADSGAAPGAFTDYILKTREALAAQPLEALFNGQVQWSAPL